MKLFFSVLLISFSIIAHEGHEIPGTIPPAPHGGQLGEARHYHDEKKHNHKNAKEREVFFEVVKTKKTLKIYPNELLTKKHVKFIDMPIKSFSDTSIRLEDARKLTKFRPEFDVQKDHWVVKLDGIKARRLFVGIRTYFKGSKYKAKIQLEMR